ncbi:hypothetical protein F893_00302 [Acinetobacter sp. CIP 102136]|nr:hypothetical protein F893_00302 [Acinetobacter sp. CIP 102136]
MPHDNEKESRTLIQEALQDPLVRIPAPLKPAYYAHQKKLTLKYLLQVNLFAQLALPLIPSPIFWCCMIFSICSF